MSPDLIRRLGGLLFGADYHAALGKALGVSRIAVHNWVKGTYQCGPDYAVRARQAIGERIKELREIRRTLR